MRPETDSVLSLYKIPDNFIPCLRVLSQTVCSTKWKFKLCTAEYGLTLKQAFHILKAVMHDIKNKPGFQVQVVSTFFLTYLIHPYRVQLQISYKKTAHFLLSVLTGLVYAVFIKTEY